MLQGQRGFCRPKRDPFTGRKDTRGRPRGGLANQTHRQERPTWAAPGLAHVREIQPEGSLPPRAPLRLYHIYTHASRVHTSVSCSWKHGCNDTAFLLPWPGEPLSSAGPRSGAAASHWHRRLTRPRVRPSPWLCPAASPHLCAHTGTLPRAAGRGQDKGPQQAAGAGGGGKQASRVRADEGKDERACLSPREAVGRQLSPHLHLRRARE